MQNYSKNMLVSTFGMIKVNVVFDKNVLVVPGVFNLYTCTYIEVLT